jgi:hypothetical protein
MNALAHRITTELAANLAWRKDGRRPAPALVKELARACVATDLWRDLEFVDVQFGRDDPHARQWNKISDRPHTVEQAKSLTSFNHFIDIQKGPGRFDDYDGYSYFRGSAHLEEYQAAKDLSGGWALLLAELLECKVDEGLNYWLNDEYVHAPGHRWYRQCSPALEHYSFPRDYGRFRTRRAELAARFPLARSVGKRGCGIPYSIFMPVDNLARYWFARFIRTGEVTALGPVLHAVQDASIPHHAAGYSGNWHVEYEDALNELASRRKTDRDFAAQAAQRALAWSRRDPHPPRRRLMLRDRLRAPGINWSVSQLVTWTALNAYQEYTETYRHFRGGFKLVVASMDKLLLLAAAMSVLVLRKARLPAT